jgi:hypothetical protein
VEVEQKGDIELYNKKKLPPALAGGLANIEFTGFSQTY